MLNLKNKLYKESIEEHTVNLNINDAEEIIKNLGGEHVEGSIYSFEDKKENLTTVYIEFYEEKSNTPYTIHIEGKKAKVREIKKQIQKQIKNKKELFYLAYTG